MVLYMVMLMVTMVRRRTFSGDYGDDGEKEDELWCLWGCLW